jgi:hypothetical protein
MSLGLAFAKGRYIHIAVEAQGVSLALPAKCFALQDNLLVASNPIVIAISTGYLDRWIYVKQHYQPAQTLSAAADQVVNLLRTAPVSPGTGPAFGLVCGFENLDPKCYRVGSHASTPTQEVLADVCVVGLDDINGRNLADEARREAQDLLRNLTAEPCAALSKAIVAQMPLPGYLAKPIQTATIEPSSRTLVLVNIP